MSRENKMIKGEDGEELWISRSIVVVCLVARITDNNKIEILVEKRGPLVSATGQWCFPCGYLDYDEDLTDAVIREVKEETGYILKRKDVNFIDNDKKQISDFELDTNEVTELKWVEIGESVSNKYSKKFIIDLKKIENVGKWAFNHKSLVVYIINRYCNKNGIELYKL